MESRERKRAEDIILPDLKLYHKAIVIKTAVFSGMKTDQGNIFESPI